MTGRTTDEVIEFDGGHTLIDTRNNFLGDGCCINMLWIETITQSGDTGGDLVELHAFLTSIWKTLSAM